MRVAHIPDLPKSDATLNLLQRIYIEFFPIVEDRGFRVLSISEMCCCGDGLDHKTTLSAAKRQKRGKRKIMATNVLGYNQTSIGRGGKTHTIHLRLRNAQNHDQLLSYEEVAGTMAHELAHCVHGAHNASFYKLMDEIQEQHAVFLARGVATEGIPMGQGYVLGGGEKNGQSAASAAEARRQKYRWMPQGPQKLGGDNSFKQWLKPGEAAAAAAEIRRREDEIWCLPCGEPCVIDLIESDSEEDLEKAETVELTDPDVIEIQENDEKLKTRIDGIIVPNFTFMQASTSDIINLTKDSDTPKEKADISEPGWVCNACTFRNNINQMLVCEICRTEKSSASAKLIAKIKRDDEVQRIKEQEVEMSRKDFGFNIYGNDEKKSATMSHIT